jgi:hypothetical protein
MGSVLYEPTREVLQQCARAASVASLIDNPPDDWDSRGPLNVPGLVWIAESDTCLTGRLDAPRNIAYDEFGAEFVFRQPRTKAELAQVMRAASADPFEAYRFDGFAQWTYASASAWFNETHVITGWLERMLAVTHPREIRDGAVAALDYLGSADLDAYRSALLTQLDSRGR